ncbi:MAG: restriction endonuclease [Kiritimatiellae bacterium]|nr:restriction endonuclease [Kiritimatiellia bacterium]
MKILIESYPYPKDRLSEGLQSIGREMRGNVYFEEVGYYLSNKIQDCVFILPKVLLWDKDKDGQPCTDGSGKTVDKVFGEYLPEDIVDPTKCTPPLRPELRKFIYGFSTWIYRALAVYRKQVPDNGIIWEKHVNHIGRTGLLRGSETLLDVLLSLQDFAKENRDFFFFVVKNRHSGLNKINWTRTIAKTPAVVGMFGPTYLNPINKKKMINFDEELLIIFFSILKYMEDVFGFPVQIDLGYELITGPRFAAYMEDGIGKRRLLAIKYKYFSDKALKLWELCYAFFDSDYQVRVNTDYEEYLQAKDFNRVFEAMIDELVGDDKKDYPTPLTNQDDGKLVDHIYLDQDLTSGDEMRRLFYIGDSKYYKQGTPVGKEAYSKQFTYAKNVIQWHLNLLLDEAADSEYSGSHNLRDEVTEGYDIVPNFFISATMNKDLDFNDGEPRPTGKPKKEYVSQQFKNRLFDRDTLLIAHYDINFLFIISLYAQNNSLRKAGWKKIVRGEFRKTIQGLLADNFEFYVMTPKKIGSEKAFLQSDFRRGLGKIYKPFKDVAGRPYYSLALEKNDPDGDNKATMEWLETCFEIEKCDRPGEDPVKLLESKVASLPVPTPGSIEGETSLFLRDAPIKGIQEAAVKAHFYPAPVETTTTPHLIRWILLSLSNKPPRMLRVRENGYLGDKWTGTHIQHTHNEFDGVAFPANQTYHVWEVDEV